MQPWKGRKKQKPTDVNVSTLNTPQDPDIAYQRTRDGCIEGLKLLKAATEATSFLGPLKAICEVSLLFLETTKTINENTKGLKQLKDNLVAHISLLDGGYVQNMESTRIDQMPDALKDFDSALRGYITGLKDILARMDDLIHSRDKGVKGFFTKLVDAKIDPGSIADFKQDIMQCIRLFEDTTKLCHIQLEADG